MQSTGEFFHGMGSMGFKFQPKKSGRKKAEATSIHSLGPETTIPISSPPKIDKESIVK